MTRSEKLRKMHSDRYVMFMLDFGYYRVEISTGDVYNIRTGVKLLPFLNKAGHPVVVLTYGPRVSRKIPVSRIVALKVWGRRVLKKRHVAHKDGNLLNNAVANLYVSDEKEGVSGRPPKTSWEPCVKCGDDGGYVSHQGVTPTRIHGARFGYDGVLCHNCYSLLFNREYRKRKREQNAGAREGIEGGT
jgi:hypothetical protein